MRREKTCLYHRRPTPLLSIRFRQTTGFHYPYPTHSSTNKSTVSSNMPENTSGHLTGEEAKAPIDLTVRVSRSIFSTISPIPSIQVPLLNIYKESLLKTKEICRGDLVFFKGRNSRRSNVGHVGLVTEVYPDGRFKFIHASTSQGIREDWNFSPYYAQRYVGARRIYFVQIDKRLIFRCHSRIGRHR